MKNIETSIIINASVSEVWNVLMDFNHYQDWNPFITSISGEPTANSRLEVKIEPEGAKSQIFKPTVLKHEANKEFRWLGHLFIKGLFDGEHYFLLRPLPQQRVEFIHGEIFTGLLSAVLMSMVGAQTQAGFNAMNQAIKNKVESPTNVM